MSMTFARATKQKSKARVGLVGPSGSGKTYTALRIALGIAGNTGRIALIDTENRSASKYADEFAFDTMALETFAPATYVEAIHAAEAAEYDVIIIDSLSHAWMGKDGALEMVDRASARYQGNSFAAWRDVTPHHTRLVDALVRCNAHLIVTMRSKTQYEIIKDEKTQKMTPRKIGLAPVQRDGMEYEFDIVADMDMDNNLVVSKSRCKSLTGAVIPKPGIEVGQEILAWLSDTTQSGDGAGTPSEHRTGVPTLPAAPEASPRTGPPSPQFHLSGKGADTSQTVVPFPSDFSVNDPKPASPAGEMAQKFTLLTNISDARKTIGYTEAATVLLCKNLLGKVLKKIPDDLGTLEIGELEKLYNELRGIELSAAAIASSTKVKK
jgi:ABC-type oligopeptide transport system ATPase subunit